MTTIFTESHIGCHADSINGHKHARNVLAMLIEEITSSIDHPGEIATGNEIIAELRAAPSDDLMEEEDALLFLNDYTADGLVWVFDCGDLLLTRMESTQ